MKIDTFCHITAPKFLKAVKKKIPPQICKKLPSTFIPSLLDLDMKFPVMDDHPHMVRVLTLTNPLIELVTDWPGSVRETIESIEKMKIPDSEKAKIYENTIDLLQR